LDNVILRYGGKEGNQGALRVADSSIDISNSVIGNNYAYGAWFKNSTSTSITSSVIKNHILPAPTSYGIFLELSSIFLQNTAFNDNQTGIIDGGGGAVADGGGNTFSGNEADDSPAGLIP